MFFRKRKCVLNHSYLHQNFSFFHWKVFVWFDHASCLLVLNIVCFSPSAFRNGRTVDDQNASPKYGIVSRKGIKAPWFQSKVGHQSLGQCGGLLVQRRRTWGGHILQNVSWWWIVGPLRVEVQGSKLPTALIIGYRAITDGCGALQKMSCGIQYTHSQFASFGCTLLQPYFEPRDYYFGSLCVPCISKPEGA